MMNRANILWGTLLACSLLCLGMRPQPVEHQGAQPQAGGSKVQQRSWERRTFLRVKRDRQGRYSFRKYGTMVPSYRIDGKSFVYTRGKEVESFLIRSSENRGANRIFSLYYERDPEGVNLYCFVPLDSLGMLWEIDGQRFVDSVYLDRLLAQPDTVKN